MLDRRSQFKLLKLVLKRDKLMENVRVLSLGDGNMQASYPHGEDLTRPMRAGFIHYLADTISSMSLLSHPNGNRISVSTTIKLSIVDDFKSDEDILLDVKCNWLDDKFASLYLSGIGRRSQRTKFVALHSKIFGKGPFFKDPTGLMAKLQQQ